MQLVAYLNGERVDATEMAHEQWRALNTHPDYREMVLLECGLRANRVTRRGRQFFKHQAEVSCGVEHKSESAQHLAMKRALQDRINAAAGWRAEVEHAHPERAWIADVLAIHESGRRLAFEVQLSAQSEDEYIRRSQRYVDDRIGPVWVVPEDPDLLRVQVPMIVTGFGKTSDLPGVPAQLMELTRHQPQFGGLTGVGKAVDAVLHPAFRWAHGTPQHQLDELASLEAMKAKAAAEHAARAEQLAEQQRGAEEKAAQLRDAATALFIDSASDPEAYGGRTVPAGPRIWGSVVRCMKERHPTLIWCLTDPRRLSAGDANWMPKRENFDNVRADVDRWLKAAGTGLVRAGVYRLQGFGDRRAFACPECKDVIKGRWVAALPPVKWFVISEGSSLRGEAREVLYRKPQAATPPPAKSVTTTVETQPPLRVATVHRPASPQEADPGFIGPQRWAYWMSEVWAVWGSLCRTPTAVE